MKRNQSPSINIESGKGVTPELIDEANRLEDNPRLMLALIDLLFLGMDEGKTIPS